MTIFLLIELLRKYIYSLILFNYKIKKIRLKKRNIFIRDLINNF